MMSNRPKDPKTARNKNVLVVGGSGSGKTRFFIKPNLMQLHSSYVVTDPKGSIAVECGKLMLRNGYKVKIFNSINFKKSHHYNPFAYIHSEKDILKLVTTLIANTKGDGKSGDDFWQKAETLLYTALIGYIHYEAPEEEQNFATLIEFINAMEVREDDETFENNVDLAFKELASREPNHFAVRQYKKYKLAAGKTAKSINISCGARLAPFDIQELREITMYDELELDTLGDRKTALFLIMSDTDSTFNFLISMIYSQLFNLLCEKADDVYGGRLPVHVRCLIDECANIGQIPNLEKLMATIRSREISACLVLQAQSQLKALYKDNADTIIGNCDSSIFLGGKEPGTLKELNQALGKETIDTFNTGESRGREVSHSLNYQKLGKELLYSFVMNSVAHNKRMNRDTTSESIIHSHQASLWEVRYVRIKDYREDPADSCCRRTDGNSVDRDLPEQYIRSDLGSPGIHFCSDRDSQSDLQIGLQIRSNEHDYRRVRDLYGPDHGRMVRRKDYDAS